LLQQSLDTRHSRCASVNEIQVHFEGSERLPETLLAHTSGKVAPSNTIATKGVFLLSDDVLLSCEELEKGKESKGCVRHRCKRCFAHSFTLPTAFQTWRTDPSRLVGFFGFRQIGSEKSSRSAANTKLGLEPVPTGSGPYSLVSDRAVFVHRLYLDSLPSREDFSCCQVLLSLQVSAASTKSPLVMRANPRELLDSNSMSSLRGGHDIRDCSSSCTDSRVVAINASIRLRRAGRIYTNHPVVSTQYGSNLRRSSGGQNLLDRPYLRVIRTRRVL
jgi:hypothetical protein